MDLHLYNTLTRNKELFTPITPGKIGMYHCGPTVYWTQHIGNMRAVVIVDFARRIFSYNNYAVTLVRNYTDVGHLTGDNIGDADLGEDRMEKAAKRENLSPDAIAQKYIDIYNRDITLLNTLPPTNTPRATEHIADMIDMVKKLLDDGFAYATDTAIWFDVSKYDDYTKLSGQKLEFQETGTGHGDISDTTKKNPHDFALWFFKTGSHANALQTWESPFTSPLIENGRGFPGWHIECSAMSKHFLGNTFDIHMGGIEHIPIHHTNEIAQSVCANHTDFVHYWLHNEHLLVDNKKMAKSEGTSYTIADITAKGFNPMALRYFFSQSHYRSKQNFTWDGLAASQTAFNRLVEQYKNLGDTTGSIDLSYKEKFNSAINDDLNIPQAIAVMWDLIKDANISLADKKATLDDFDKVLGFDLARQSQIEDIIPEEIKQLVAARTTARMEKNWSESDRLRDEIEAKGYMIKDTDNGTEVKKK